MKKHRYLIPIIAVLVGAAGLPIHGDPIFSPHLTTPLVSAAAKAKLPADAAAERDERLTPLFWMSHQQGGDDVIFTAPQIRLQNAIMRNKTNALCDLTQAPGYLTYWRLTYMLRNLTKEAFPSRMVPELYNGMQPVSQEEFAKVRDNVNLDAVGTANFVRYGVLVNRSDVRLLPTDAVWSRLRGDVLHDSLQRTALDPATPVAVLHTSADGNYVFVQGRDALGWVKAEDVALTDKETWLEYVNPPQDVAVVTARRKVLVDQGQYRVFQMGATIPLASYQSRLYLQMPSRDADGNLEIHRLRTGWDETLHQGYLPFTQNNVLRQSFRFLGVPYHAGSSWEGVDDAGLTYAVYRTMGLRLPRTASEQQEVLPLKADFAAEDTTADRQQVLKSLPTGSLLFAPQHVMLYLGEDSQGDAYVLHNVDSHYQVYAAEQQPLPATGVAVSKLESDGTTSHSLAQLTGAGSFYQRNDAMNAPPVVAHGKD